MKLRQGKWVIWNERIGVVLTENDNQVDIHLVDEHGVTVEQIKSDVKFLRLAEPHEIPAARRVPHIPAPIPAPSETQTTHEEKVTLWPWFSQMVAKILR